MLTEVVTSFLLLSSIFIPLELFFGHHYQKILRSDWKRDILYYFVGYFIGRGGLALISAFSLILIGQGRSLGLPKILISQSIFLQFLEIVVIAEIGYYCAHRLLHTVPFLWKFHAIHHSSLSLDWLATIRVHPCDQMLTKICQLLPLYYLGFNDQVLEFYLLFSAGISFFIHANIKVRFPLLRWLIVTPEYHHWHHSNDLRYANHNFTAQLPFIDLLFGTFYLPSDRQPERYGISEFIPNQYLLQLIYPFQGIGLMLKKIGLSSSLIALVGIVLVTGSAFAFAPICTNMNLPTLIASIGTQTISIDQLKKRESKDILLIDVRTPEEYEEDHIGNSILVPVDEIEQGLGLQRIRSLLKSKGNSLTKSPTVILYCTSGMRSIKASKALEAERIHSFVLAGGITVWRKSVSPEQDLRYF